MSEESMIEARKIEDSTRSVNQWEALPRMDAGTVRHMRRWPRRLLLGIAVGLALRFGWLVVALVR